MLSFELPYKKIIFSLILLMTCSAIAIAVDCCNEEDCPACSIYAAKSQLNGTQNTTILGFHPTTTCCYSIEQPMCISLRISAPRENRAPPIAYPI